MRKSSVNRPSMQQIKKVLSEFDINLPEYINLSNFHGDLTNDSRRISSGNGIGDIFCAIIGHVQDGRLYIAKAIENGAKLVLSECKDSNDHGKIKFVESTNGKVAVISFYLLNKKLFNIASAYYESPEKSMTMVGITGTNGKTSTSQLLGQLLTLCKKPCAIIGTNGAGMVDDLQVLENTTPSATDLMQLFYDFSQEKAGKKITHLAMEVSSHALEQKRVTGNVFDIAVFTNLSREHLDYHGTMADYAAAKRQLFTHNEKQIAVLNGDEQQTQLWLENWSTSDSLWIYGRSELVRQQRQFVSCGDIEHHNQGVTFLLKTHLGDIEIQSALLGDFNIDNLLAVIAVLLIEEISLATIAEKISNIKAIAGRMEAFSSHNAPTAVVDYAHTPDALEKALIACKQHCHGNLFVVFGCGGDRDKGKRPLMAQAAQQYADMLVVTNDNPRTESPMSIIEDVLAGLSDKSKVQVIVDRKRAVLETLENAKSNDVVLLAGKGHEDYIILGQNKVDYNERQIVKDYFYQLEQDSSAGERL